MRLNPWISGLADHIRTQMLDAVYPRCCIGCGGTCDDVFGSWCWDCAGRIQYLHDPLCACCGEPVEGRVDAGFTCASCAARPPAFDQARSAARFDGVVRESIHGFKYRAGLWLAPDLTSLLEACVQSWYEPHRIDLVAPVPLHPTRFRARGFNQSTMLGARLARRMSLRFDRRCLRRVRPTESQTHLTARERPSNVRGAFAVGRPRAVRNRRILVIDDVMTTGSTVSEISRVLKLAGAAAVWVATVARG